MDTQIPSDTELLAQWRKQLEDERAFAAAHSNRPSWATRANAKAAALEIKIRELEARKTPGTHPRLIPIGAVVYHGHDAHGNEIEPIRAGTITGYGWADFEHTLPLYLVDGIRAATYDDLLTQADVDDIG